MENQKPQESKQNPWDCGSSLYDSFELKSFKRQLDSAIASRTFSMPRLPPPLAPPPPVSKKSSKISRSLHRFLRSVFRSSKSPNSNSLFQLREKSEDGFYVVYDTSGALTTIPEVPEIDYVGLSPEINAVVRRTASERFGGSSTSIGISCA